MKNKGRNCKVVWIEFERSRDVTKNEATIVAANMFLKESDLVSIWHGMSENLDLH